jgi:hypothetical protein
MTKLSDTSLEAERALCEVLRNMPFERKWRQMGAIYHTGRLLHATGVRFRRPDATPEDILADWVKQSGLETFPIRQGRVGQMNSDESLRVVEHIVRVLEQLQIPYAVAGSWASAVHGKLRFTHDADLCVEPFPGKEQAFCSSLGEDYYVSLPAVRDAVQQHRSFNVINTLTSFKVDLFVAKPRLYDQSLLSRRQLYRVGGDAGISVQVVTPEDVILLKLEWFRLGNEVARQQWEDVLGVFQVQAARLDLDYLDRWATALGVADLLERARQELAGA